METWLILLKVKIYHAYTSYMHAAINAIHLPRPTQRPTQT